MAHDQAIRDAWLWQAATCEGMGAPFTAALLRGMVEDEPVRAAFSPLLQSCAGLSARALLTAASPLRILGGLHYLVLSGAAPELAQFYATKETVGLESVLAEAAGAHAAALRRFMASPPQTNEVRRSLCLVGGFLEVARSTRLPLRCLELGASGGLNMNWDAFRYAFGGEHAWGSARSALVLSGDWTGGPPPVDAQVTVAERRGCDQAPIDVQSEDGALHLQAYIWPEQVDRLERMRLAIEIARARATRVEAADAGGWTAEAAHPAPGVATVVYHSVFIQYPPAPVRETILANIRAGGSEATPDAPFAWLRMEPSADAPMQMEVRLTTWPGGDDRRLADVHPHGATVHWVLP